jgi:hypothetical protein
MGVDYSAVAGFSIKMTDELKARIRACAEELPDWDEEEESELAALDLDYAEVGCSYSGTTEQIPILIPESALGLDAKVASWLENINTTLHTSYEVKDVIFIRDILVW